MMDEIPQDTSDYEKPQLVIPYQEKPSNKEDHEPPCMQKSTPSMITVEIYQPNLTYCKATQTGFISRYPIFYERSHLSETQNYN